MTFTQEDRVAELNAFLDFAMTKWPQEREHHLQKISPRCSRCFVSAAYTPLVDRVCKYCRETSGPKPAETVPPHVIEELADTLRAAEGKGRGRHDAIVMFSGGKDSTYMVHRLKTEFPRLRLLTLMIDNGFSSSIALASSARIAGKLGLDHVLYRPEPALFAKTFRYTLTHLSPGGCYATVDRFDGDLMIDITLNLASQMGIPLVIHGGSYAQLERILGLKDFRYSEAQLHTGRDALAGIRFKDVYDEQQLQNWWDGTGRPENEIPRLLFPLYAWRHDEMFLRNEVIRLGLIQPGNENPLVTNNDTLPVMLALDVAKYGFSFYEPEFAQMAREGKTDRTWWLNFFEALEYQVKHGLFAPGCIDSTLARLGLTRRDLGIP